jgi:hypothetical protein
MTFGPILDEMHTLLDPLASQPCRRRADADCGQCATCLARRALRILTTRLGLPM